MTKKKKTLKAQVCDKCGELNRHVSFLENPVKVQGKLIKKVCCFCTMEAQRDLIEFLKFENEDLKNALAVAGGAVVKNKTLH